MLSPILREPFMIDIHWQYASRDKCKSKTIKNEPSAEEKQSHNNMHTLNFLHVAYE